MIFAASLLGMSSALAQNAPIRGTVVDSGNQPVIGAAVMVPGTTLEVSCIGYQTKRVNYFLK